MKVVLDIDKAKLVGKLEEFQNTTGSEADLTDYLHEQEGEGWEIRAFPCSDTGADPDVAPVDYIVIEVHVDEDQSWYDESLEYGMKHNLRNGDSKVYEFLADAVEEAAEEAGLGRVALTGRHGTTFTAEPEV